MDGIDRLLADDGWFVVEVPWGRDIIRTKEQMNRILAERTGQTYEKVKSDTERDYFMTATEAQEYGLVDTVVEKRP